MFRIDVHVVRNYSIERVQTDRVDLEEIHSSAGVGISIDAGAEPAALIWGAVSSINVTEALCEAASTKQSRLNEARVLIFIYKRF